MKSLLAAASLPGLGTGTRPEQLPWQQTSAWQKPGGQGQEMTQADNQGILWGLTRTWAWNLMGISWDYRDYRGIQPMMPWCGSRMILDVTSHHWHYIIIYIHNMFKINGYCSRADWFGYPPDSSDPWTLFLNLRRWWTLVGAFFGGDEKTYCGEYYIYIFIINIVWFLESMWFNQCHGAFTKVMPGILIPSLVCEDHHQVPICGERRAV